MLFDTECRVADDPAGADRRAMEQILARQGKAPPGYRTNARAGRGSQAAENG
jgi:hypothetical protein